MVTDATVSHMCDHCRSLLLVEAPEREEVFVEPARVKEPAEILETLLLYRIDAHRSTLVARHSDEEGNPPPDFLINSLLSRFERQLRQNAKLLEWRPIHVPYRQTSGKVVQAVLGRHGDGAKIARLRGFIAEQTTPAYDPRYNLRDAGLRLGRAVFRPLLSGELKALGGFVPRAKADASRRDLEKWRTRDLEAGFESVTKKGEVIVTFEATVYRPFFMVRASLDRGDELLLFDAGFGTIAGYLSPEEADAFMRGEETDPLGTQGATFRHVAVIPARCPNCGADPKLEEEATLSVCENCHAGFTPTAQGLTLRNYEREEGVVPNREMTFIPFWRFPFEIKVAGAPPLTTLDAYAAALFPQGAPKDFAPQGPFVFVPGWRLLTTLAGDETFAAIARTFHAAGWNWTPDRVGLEARPTFVPVSMPEEEARSLAWASLFALHTKSSAARLNTLLLKRMLFDAKLSFGRGTVCLVGFRNEEAAYVRPNLSVPRLVVEGGPVLAAQQVTVQAAAAAQSAAKMRPSMADRVRTSRFNGGEDR